MSNKKSSKKGLYIAIGLILAVIIFSVVAKRTGIIGGEPKISVDLGKVSKKTIVEKVSASGDIQPEREIKISPDVPGEIMELNVEEGDSVREGQLLLKIRDDNYIAALSRSQAALDQNRANAMEAKARLASVEAQFLRSKLSYERNKKLYEDDVISTAEYEQVEADYKVAQEELNSSKLNLEATQFLIKSAQASVDEAKQNLTFTQIYAPSSGVISKLDVEKGERVVGTSQMAGTEMLRIADLSRMEVKVDVNENDIIRVSKGDTAIIDVDSYTFSGRKFKGIVTAIANTANQKASAESVTEFEVLIRILPETYAELVTPAKPFPFRPGMTASVEIITQTKENALSVPLAAVTTRQKNNNDEAAEQDDVKEIVFLVEGDAVREVEVKTGLSDFKYIEIIEGLKEGDQIVVGPYFAVSKRLKDGDLVTFKEKEAVSNQSVSE
ncbi:MAG: efflux RND transporter periplasmic adaptor subunit [Cyclobacteriaceae bacterium]|nr:efflux RND transporter periplasmic adaptor subunit [Cyclobacteriaceae bacterium]MCH8514884.1 efflux RND transporter periplasmic adaptor subunit [Cyclobacteriaceae bacterium]